MNNTNEIIEKLYQKLDAQDAIIDQQALEISQLKEQKKQAIEYIKNGLHWFCRVNEDKTIEAVSINELLEILGDKE